MKRFMVLIALAAGMLLLLTACGQPAPAPTPVKSQPEPTKAAVAAPSPAAPTKAPAQPTAVPPTAAPKVNFPEKGKPITVIVPFAAGGASDTASRLIAPLLEADLGTPIQVVNKPGASTQVGATELATAKPDGHTLGLVGFAAILLSYLDPDRKATYTRKSFQPVAHYAVNDNLILVKADSPLRDVKDLVAAAKKGDVKMGTSGLMSNTHLASLMLETAAEVKFAYVHFDSGSLSITSLLGGHLDAVMASSGDMMTQYRGGTVRVLGTMGQQQSKLFPEVKTFEAQGYKAFSVYSFGVAAPAGIPMPVVDLLSQSLKKAMGNKELVSKLFEMGMDVDYKDPAQFESFWVDYETRVKPMLELAKSRQ